LGEEAGVGKALDKYSENKKIPTQEEEVISQAQRGHNLGNSENNFGHRDHKDVVLENRPQKSKTSIVISKIL